jgi:hypothetical protein
VRRTATPAGRGQALMSVSCRKGYGPPTSLLQDGSRPARLPFRRMGRPLALTPAYSAVFLHFSSLRRRLRARLTSIAHRRKPVVQLNHVRAAAPQAPPSP